jgi:hypothetical protein
VVSVRASVRVRIIDIDTKIYLALTSSLTLTLTLTLGGIYLIVAAGQNEASVWPLPIPQVSSG